MSNYDAPTIYSATSSDAAASAGLTIDMLIHKVVLYNLTPATVASSVLVYNAPTASGAIKVALNTELAAASIATQYREANFDPPIFINARGLSTTLAGSTGTTVKIYYTPA